MQKSVGFNLIFVCPLAKTKDELDHLNCLEKRPSLFEGLEGAMKK
jgi:hypothetical protein